jgi:hypothetical protein
MVRRSFRWTKMSAPMLVASGLLWALRYRPALMLIRMIHTRRGQGNGGTVSAHIGR